MFYSIFFVNNLNIFQNFSDNILLNETLEQFKIERPSSMPSSPYLTSSHKYRVIQNKARVRLTFFLYHLQFLFISEKIIYTV